MAYDIDRDPEVVAGKKGLVVVKPGDDELFIDIDDLADLPHVFTGIKFLAAVGIKAAVTDITLSGTPGHLHCYARVDRKLKPVERVVLQACLGSDRKRELISVARLLLGGKYPTTVFFEKEQRQKKAVLRAIHLDDWS